MIMYKAINATSEPITVSVDIPGLLVVSATVFAESTTTMRGFGATIVLSDCGWESESRIVRARVFITSP
jgi:hypothetical protein